MLLWASEGYSCNYLCLSIESSWIVLQNILADVIVLPSPEMTKDDTFNYCLGTCVLLAGWLIFGQKNLSALWSCKVVGVKHASPQCV